MAVYKRKSQNDGGKTDQKSRSSLRPVTVIGSIQPMGMMRKKRSNTIPQVKVTVDRGTGRVLAIKSDRVFAQIARVSRNPKKMTEKKLLVDALNNATVSIDRASGSKRAIREFVPMSEDVAKLCFGKQFERLPKSSVIQVAEKEARQE